ncbi:hypothetical protein [Enterovibrio norvegicus]|uniref:hypothetical protein n=1 Tax=Enterovibrio norvegicus TaxID=188144 RepID=UPI000C8231C5|nr:hypothetical protein [Enterovibrio norvegicus]PMH64447.1 hypothetical protein BCU62_15445 [Enterovibrio norvegicus]
MEKKLALFLLCVLMSGCQSVNQHHAISNAVEIDEKTPTALDYPQVSFAKMSVAAGSQTLTAANKLADELGVEFVEWAKELNPYEYYQLRSKRIELDFEEPQKPFLDLFDRSGLLPYYDNITNTVSIYPYSLNERVSAPYIFTPKFARSEKQKKAIIDAYEDDLAKRKKVLEYHYYKGFSVKETINAWAQHANYSGVVWFLNDSAHQKFTSAALQKDDSNIGVTSMDVMNTFLKSEINRQGFDDLPLTLVLDKSKNLLIVHPFARTEVVKAFEIQPSSIKYNLQKISDFYGYDLDYRASDFAVTTGYTTVLTSFVENSVNTVVQQYPLTVEVIDSTKEIIVRGNG